MLAHRHNSIRISIFIFLTHFEPMKPLSHVPRDRRLLFELSLARSGDADWPQWRGPNRDGHAAPQQLLKRVARRRPQS